MKAYLKNYRQSPRKVRLVVDFVRGRRVDDALLQLQFMPKRAARAIAKLISSAVANAEHNFKVAPSELVVSDIRVDEGITMKRFNPVSRGRAHRINKRSSNVTVAVAPAKTAATAETAPVKEEKEEKKPAPKKKTTKKPVTKKSVKSNA